MNTLFKINSEKTIGRYDRNIHKDLIIPGRAYRTNKKLSVTVQPKNAFNLELADHL